MDALGDVAVYERTKPAEIIVRAADADIVLTNKVVLSKEIIAQLPKLRYVGVLATGYNVVDVKAAHERDIVVTNVPAYSTESVAQMVFAHLLTVTNRDFESRFLLLGFPAHGVGGKNFWYCRFG